MCRNSANTRTRCGASSLARVPITWSRAAAPCDGKRVVRGASTKGTIHPAGWIVLYLMQRYVTGFRLAGYGAAYFFASGAFMSYWPVWLRDRGITDAEIGTLFMSRQLVSVVSVLSIGVLAHRVGRLRDMLLMMAVAAIVMMGVYQLSYSFLALLLVGLVWACVW